MAGPLDGILVVSLEQAVAAPLCTQRLLDAGARVIKIERPEGDFARGYDAVAHGESAYFAWLNQGKESIALDIKAPGAAALIHAMIARADVFVQNLAPGAAARAGLGSAELRAAHPRLVTCDISGYGDDAGGLKAYDLLIQCEAGLASITGGPEAPARVGVSVADIACGLNAYAAILEALYAARATGTGSGVAVSLFDSIAEWMTVPLLHHDYGGAAPARVGLSHPSIAPYGAFACADGKQVVFSIQNPREWVSLCRDVLGDPALADDPHYAENVARVANRAALEARIAPVFAAIAREEAMARLTAAAIGCARVNEVADLSAHPSLRRIEARAPTGPVTMPARPVRRSGEESAARAVPALDQHGAALAAEFGTGVASDKASGTTS